MLETSNPSLDAYTLIESVNDVLFHLNHYTMATLFLSPLPFLFSGAPATKLDTCNICSSILIIWCWVFVWNHQFMCEVNAVLRHHSNILDTETQRIGFFVVACKSWTSIKKRINEYLWRKTSKFEEVPKFINKSGIISNFDKNEINSSEQKRRLPFHFCVWNTLFWGYFTCEKNAVLRISIYSKWIINVFGINQIKIWNLDQGKDFWKTRRRFHFRKVA